jgi:DNA-binding response OmpR family regulator
MARILSISYDEALLRTREMLLKGKGFKVESAVGFSAALHACEHQTFDLVIMGHSIPPEDKEQIIHQLRRVCQTPVLALRRSNDPPLKIAEYNLDSWEPEIFLENVEQITRQKT